MAHNGFSFFRMFSWIIATGVAGVYAATKVGKGVAHPFHKKEEDDEERAERLVKENQMLPTGTVIDEHILKDTGEEPFFSINKITQEMFSYMRGRSIPTDAEVDKTKLRLVRVLYYGFDENSHIGEIIVHRKIAEDVLEIFRELYHLKYPIEKMKLMDYYDGDDNLSMADNNTSGFNYRYIARTTNLSKHAKGMAIDVNPKYNPYIYTVDDVTYIEPENGKKYAERKLDFPYKITREDACCKIFLEHGFYWGGQWKNRKDYQHFEYKKRRENESGQQ